MSQHHSERVVGTFEGKTPGQLVIVIAALHGNEPAGVRALEEVFEQLEKEHRANPHFQFRGKLVGLIGNLQAFQLSQRFLERDLNRLWTKEFLEKTKASPKEAFAAESREASELFEFISAQCQPFQAEKTVFLDLHTTSAEGGIFSIPIDERNSLALAKCLGAPAIMGLQKSIEGTLLKFASEGGFSPNHQSPNHQSLSANAPSRLGVTITNSPISQFPNRPICVAFEAGQHENPQSARRAAAAIARCLRAVGCIGEEDLQACEAAWPLPLWPHSPPVLQLRYAHHIGAGDGFQMLPGYANFQPIQKGEHLADDLRGPVLSPDKGLILMPLYQAKGSDGFFIVQ